MFEKKCPTRKLKSKYEKFYKTFCYYVFFKWLCLIPSKKTFEL